MGTINKQTSITPSLNDQMAIWQTANGDTRKTSLNYLLTLFQDNIELPGATEAQTQYSAPSTNDFNILINDNNMDTHLILTPSTNFADGAITLPVNTNLRDKQILIVNTTQQISTFTVNLNGSAGVHGVPSSLGADDFFTIKYDFTVNTWYRIA